MKLHRSFAFIITALALTACSTFEVSLEARPVNGPVKSTAPAKLSGPAQTSPLQPAAMETMSASTSISQEGDLPPQLYFLGNQSLWRLEPGGTVIEPITPSDQKIASFDVWPGDSRIAYGTSDGQLFVMMSNQTPRLLHNVGTQTNYPIEIGSVAWSPDGERLAYTVHYTSEQAQREAAYPSYPSGLWLLDMKEATPTWLLSNHHMVAGKLDPNAVQSIWNPRWSPDGTALILTGMHWEWRTLLWLDSLAPNINETHLRTYPEIGWWDGSWRGDSQSLLISGRENAVYSDLVQMNRVSLESKMLVAGAADGLYISDAQELPSGIVFQGAREGKTRLYLGRHDATEFKYTPVGPEYLCNSLYVQHIEWDRTGQWGAVVCDGDSFTKAVPARENEVYVVTLDGKKINITPYLGPLSFTEALEARWGK